MEKELKTEAAAERTKPACMAGEAAGEVSRDVKVAATKAPQAPSHLFS